MHCRFVRTRVPLPEHAWAMAASVENYYMYSDVAMYMYVVRVATDEGAWKPTISIVFLSMALKLRFYHFLSMERLFLSFLSFWVVFLSVSISFTRFGGCFYLFLLFLSVSIVSIVSIHFLRILTHAFFQAQENNNQRITNSTEMW